MACCRSHARSETLACSVRGHEGVVAESVHQSPDPDAGKEPEGQSAHAAQYAAGAVIGLRALPAAQPELAPRAASPLRTAFEELR